MAEPCRASARIGCPDCQTVLVCHQPSPHPGLNHYDASELIWWQRTDAEPVLHEGGEADELARAEHARGIGP